MQPTGRNSKPLRSPCPVLPGPGGSVLIIPAQQMPEHADKAEVIGPRGSALDAQRDGFDDAPSGEPSRKWLEEAPRAAPGAHERIVSRLGMCSA